MFTITEQQPMGLSAVADKVRLFLTAMEENMPNQSTPFQVAMIDDGDDDPSVIFSHPNVVIHIEYRE